MDAGQVEMLDQLLFMYKCVFAAEEQELGCATGVEHDIHLTSDMPIKLPYSLILRSFWSKV